MAADLLVAADARHRPARGSDTLTTPSYRIIRRRSLSADNGDADVVLDKDSASIQFFSTTLTGNKTVTLPTDAIAVGETFRIVRTGLGNFTLDVGGVKTIPSATAAWVEVAYNGSAWVLIGYSTL